MSLVMRAIVSCDAENCDRTVSVKLDKECPENIAEVESRIAENGWLTAKSGEKHFCQAHGGR